MNFFKGLFGGKTQQDDSQDFEETQHVLPPSPVRVPTPAPAPVPAPAPAPPPPPAFRIAPRTPTTVDFPAVLKRSGVDAEQQQRVKKAQDLLRSLPEDSPAELKRQIVEAAFTAFDVPTQKIIDAATLEVEALETFIAAGGAATQKILDDGSARIAELEAEIAEIRASMATAVSDQQIRDRATQQQIAGVTPILTFFAQGNGLQQPFFAQSSGNNGGTVQPFFPPPPPEVPTNSFFDRPASSGFSDIVDDVDLE
jgi:hypothetical protein